MKRRASATCHVLAGSAMLLLLAARPGASQARYNLTDIGVAPDGVALKVQGLGPGGQVVGYGDTGPSNAIAGFLWENGNLTVLSLPGASAGAAYAINADGVAAGQVNLGSATVHATVWVGGVCTDLGALGGPADTSVAYAVNALGDVAGSWSYGGAGEHAFLATGSTITDLGTLPGHASSGALSVNRAQQVVGYSIDSSSVRHAFLWQNGVMQELVAFGGRRTQAASINESGLVVGVSNYHPVLWDRYGAYDLGDLGGGTGQASSINNAGQIVGSVTDLFYNQRAVLWDGRVVTDLNTLIDPASGWVLIEATAINDAGQIIGYGARNGSRRCFLLTPVSAPSDTTAPQTTAAVSGPAGSDGWYTGPVQVSLSASDPDDTADAVTTYYTLDGGSQETCTAPIPVSSDGIHALTFWSVDKASNAETAQLREVKVDQTAPATTFDVAVSGASATVTLAASDNLSGVVETRYCVDGGPDQPYTGAFTVTGAAPVVTFWSVDAAGNTEARQSQTITIDATPPAITAYALVLPYLPAERVVPVLLFGRVTDAGTGVDTDSIQYAAFNSAGQTIASGPVYLYSNGDYAALLTLPAPPPGSTDWLRACTIVVQAKDKVGNAGAGTASTLLICR